MGVLTPTTDIIERERKIVELLVQGGLNVLSGLAGGCDTVAHKSCIDAGGKTIAFLPTTLDSIYPKENTSLAQQIVRSGGLVITEYIAPPANRYEHIKRFIERDRLQVGGQKRVDISRVKFQMVAHRHGGKRIHLIKAVVLGQRNGLAIVHEVAPGSVVSLLVELL